MNNPIIRFIALYDHGFSFPIQRLILGHGYKDTGGKDHNTLAQVFKVTADDKKYAGYLWMPSGRIQVQSGGSQTLGIEPDEKLDRELESNLQNMKGWRDPFLDLFQLIGHGKIQHVMIASQ